MEMSVSQSNQSMETKGICIFLMNEDLTCNNIVVKLIQCYDSQELHTGDVSDVFKVIYKTKDRLQLVLTKVYILESDANAISQNVLNNFSLPILYMDPDKPKMVPKGQTSSFAAFVINNLSKEQVTTTLQGFELRMEKGKLVTNNQEEHNAQIANMAFDAVGKSNSLTTSEETCTKKHKEYEDQEEDFPIQKKGRVHWSPEMHKKFIDAIEIIGEDKAVPKRIVEVMNIPGLTRENVASHLQKHRENIKREIAFKSQAANEFISSYLLPQQSTRSSCFAEERYNITTLQRSSSVPHARDPPSLFYRQNLINRQNMFSSSSGRNSITNMSSMQFGQRYVPSWSQSSRNFRVYSDQTRNVLLTMNSSDNNQSTDYNFMGFKLINEGNRLQFGRNEVFLGDKSSYDASGSSQTKFTGYAPQHNNPVSDENLNPFISHHESSLLENILDQCELPQESLSFTSLCSPETDGNLQQQDLLQPYESEYTETLLDQLHDVSDILFQDSLETCHASSKEPLINLGQENTDMIPSTFVPDQNVLLPGSDMPNDDIEIFSEGISELYSPPSSRSHVLQEFNDFLHHEDIDNVLLNGTGSTSSTLNWKAIGDSLFDNDDYC